MSKSLHESSRIPFRAVVMRPMDESNMVRLWPESVRRLCLVATTVLRYKLKRTSPRFLDGTSLALPGLINRVYVENTSSLVRDHPRTQLRLINYELSNFLPLHQYGPSPYIKRRRINQSVMHHPGAMTPGPPALLAVVKCKGGRPRGAFRAAPRPTRLAPQTRIRDSQLTVTTKVYWGVIVVSVSTRRAYAKYTLKWQSLGPLDPHGAPGLPEHPISPYVIEPRG